MIVMRRAFRAAVVFAYLATFAAILVCPCVAAPRDSADHGCCETPAGLSSATSSCCTAVLGESDPAAVQAVSFSMPLLPAALRVAAAPVARSPFRSGQRPRPILSSSPPVLRI
jgi:hypothetical protein